MIFPGRFAKPRSAAARGECGLGPSLEWGSRGDGSPPDCPQTIGPCGSMGADQKGHPENSVPPARRVPSGGRECRRWLSGGPPFDTTSHRLVTQGTGRCIEATGGPCKSEAPSQAQKAARSAMRSATQAQSQRSVVRPQAQESVAPRQARPQAASARRRSARWLPERVRFDHARMCGIGRI